MKNKSTLVSLVFATGSVVALVMILGNLENPPSSPSANNTVVSPVGQGKVASTGIMYEYDFDDEKDDENDNDNKKHNGKHNGKGKNYGRNNQPLPSTAAPSTSIPSTNSIIDSTQIQQNPRQSTTQAS